MFRHLFSKSVIPIFISTKHIPGTLRAAQGALAFRLTTDPNSDPDTISNDFEL